jgi:hypothetical protein
MKSGSYANKILHTFGSGSVDGTCCKSTGNGGFSNFDRGYQKVEVETDAKEVIKLIDDPGGGRSCIASIRQEIEELRGYFTSFKICFIGRQANMAAHLCARKATRFRRRCLWINYDPPFLSETLAKDCNSCETF